ncbi:RBM19 family protein [Megaselia abdita]
MSRIIVKGLPKTITQEKLRSQFGEKGTITDIQLKYTKEGIFRQFAYIGYQNEDDASEAITTFDKTFIQTSKITVEKCAALGEHGKTWSKHSKKVEKESPQEEEKPKKKDKKALIEEIIGGHKDDPKFQEFMQAHDTKRNLWGNDAEMVKTEEEEKPLLVPKKEEEDKEEDEDEETPEEKLADREISDLDYMKQLKKGSSSNTGRKSINLPKDDFFTIKIREIPYNCKRSKIEKFFKPLKPDSIRFPQKEHGFCWVGFKAEVDFKKALLKDKSFIDGKQVFLKDFTEGNRMAKSKLTEETPKDQRNPKWAKQEESLAGSEEISESGKIFFRNLSYTTTEDQLEQLFQKYGPVAEVNLPVDSVTRQIKGFGTVTFVMPEHGVQAFNELDGSIFQGRLLHLIPAKGRNTEEDEAKFAQELEGMNFKEKKEALLKKSAQKNNNWNTLFLGADAVANILAGRFDTSKETILDSSNGGSSAAVRLALGETEIVLEMKKFLEENDVCLDAFENVKNKKSKRSKTVFLAKNLPADTKISELRPLFEKFGEIGRFILPPSGVTALIEFMTPTEARKAFLKLAYSKFKHAPLYLEWAPENTFKSESSSTKSETKSDPMETDEPEVKQEVKPVEPVKEEDEFADVPVEAETTLFLRNLNFKTREDAIKEHFKKLGLIHSIQVAMKKDPQNPKEKISLGYGFIQFKKKATAEKALRQMQFTNIEGNQVELKKSDRILKGSEEAQPSGKQQMNKAKQTGTKILVRNIAFQAKANEIREIFKAFGELKAVRLPKKISSSEEDSHKGYGFVDFNTSGEAKKAFDALCQSTHLYGRRLVLEWATVGDEDNVEALRKRTAQIDKSRNSGADFGPSAAKKGKAVFDMDEFDIFKAKEKKEADDEED